MPIPSHRLSLVHKDGGIWYDARIARVETPFGKSPNDRFIVLFQEELGATVVFRRQVWVCMWLVRVVSNSLVQGPKCPRTTCFNSFIIFVRLRIISGTLPRHAPAIILGGSYGSIIIPQFSTHASCQIRLIWPSRSRSSQSSLHRCGAL